MDVRERLAAGEFNNKVPDPDRSSDRAVRSAALKAYHAGQDVANAEFRVALESENHMLNHPKADRLWDLAWSDGHSSGLQDVIHYYEEFLTLIDTEAREALKNLLPMFESLAVQVHGPDALAQMMNSKNPHHPYREAKKLL